MFHGNFESADEALISLRSLALALTPSPAVGKGGDGLLPKSL